VEVLEADERVDVQGGEGLRALLATCSMSMPPCVESITNGAFAARSKMIEA
jgi:hypothetical protein